MNFFVPQQMPRYRFMRYVRPSASERMGSPELPSLFPMRPETREMRVGVDVETIRVPSVELLEILKRDETLPILLVHNEESPPDVWLNWVSCREWYQWEYGSGGESSKLLDSTLVPVAGYKGDERFFASQGTFFDVYTQLDEVVHSDISSSSLSLEERQREAALTAAASAIGVDVIVTYAPTAMRHDVADNDRILSVTPSQLVPLYGHYLRMTGNVAFETRQGELVGGGTFRYSSRSPSIIDLRLQGVKASVPHFDAILLMAFHAGDRTIIQSAQAIELRLARASRAVDELLAALGNESHSEGGKADVAEVCAEAFDRIMLYLNSAMERYARLVRILADSELEKEPRNANLTSRIELDKIIAGFRPSVAADELRSLQSYARLVGQLRHMIHSLPLDTRHQFSRGYGSFRSVALTVEDIPEFNEPGNPLNQEQFDRLGVWLSDSSNGCGETTRVADIATVSTTLFGKSIRYIDELSRFLLVGEVDTSVWANPHRVLGCLRGGPDNLFEEHPGEAMHRRMLGWAEFD
nr:hypothetical protein [Corynebacterium lactis]